MYGPIERAGASLYGLNLGGPYGRVAACWGK